VPSAAPVRALKKNRLRSVTLLVRWQRAWLPPPGSCPKTRTRPSQVNAAEWPMVTPATVWRYRTTGLATVPPPAPPRLNTVNPLPPAHAASIAVPRITPVSWHARPVATRWRNAAPAGLASGMRTMSIPGWAAAGPRRSRCDPAWPTSGVLRPAVTLADDRLSATVGMGSSCPVSWCRPGRRAAPGRR
jgi:hypothetical protein